MKTVLALSWTLLVLFGAPPAAAQGRVTFDRRAHLEAYEEIALSEFADLYDVEPFVREEGKSVDPARLEELKRAWAAERARVEALLAAERAEPRRWALFRLERALARHAFFSRISWTRLDDVGGFVVYVQDPKKDDPEYAPRVARENAARLVGLRHHFHDAYVVPAGLVRRDDFGAEVLFVLASSADLSTYARLTGASSHYRAWSYYDGKLRAAVLFEDPFDKRITKEEKDRAARHAYAHLMLHAHEAGQRVPAQEDWLREGLASALADLVQDESGHWVAPDPPREAVRALVAVTQSRDTVLTHFRRLADLCGLPTHRHVSARAWADAKQAGRDPRRLDMDELTMSHWRESALWVDFLQRGERRAGFLRLLGDELRGEGGAEACRRAFPDAASGALDRAFLEHLLAEHRRQLPDVAIDPSAIEAVLQQDAALAPAPAKEGAPARAAAADAAEEGQALAPVRPVEPADLAPRDLAPEAELALCLDLARRGRTREAQARLAEALTGALANTLEAAARARLERARDQVGAWNRLRAAWYAGLAARGESQRFEHDGKAVRAAIERVEDGVLILAENRAGLRTIVLDQVDPIELAKGMGREGEALPDGWARALPYALAGDKKAARMLDGKGAAAEALAADLAGDLPALLARGVPLGELLELSRAPIPPDPAGCEEVLARLAGIVTGHGEQPEIAALLPELRGYARRALEVVFEREGAPQLVAGKWEALPERRVRLTYEFDDPSELLDFVPDDEYLASRRAVLGSLRGGPGEVEVTGGALFGTGSKLLRHRLGFQAPISVRYDELFELTDAVRDPEVAYSAVGICDDGRGNHAAAYGLQHLEVFEGKRPTSANPGEPTMFTIGATYALELAHDGAGKVTLSLGGLVQQELPTSLTRGGVFLLFHTDMSVRIRRLVIEGALDEEALAKARAAWIEDRLAERGL